MEIIYRIRRMLFIPVTLCSLSAAVDNALSCYATWLLPCSREFACKKGQPVSNLLQNKIRSLLTKLTRWRLPSFVSAMNYTHYSSILPLRRHVFLLCNALHEPVVVGTPRMPVGDYRNSFLLCPSPTWFSLQVLFLLLSC